MKYLKLSCGLAGPNIHHFRPSGTVPEQAGVKKIMSI